MAEDFDAGTYGSAFEALLKEPRLNVLGPGSPNESAREALDALAVETAFAGQKVVDTDMAQACISGALLYHNFLSESHTLSQQINTPTGSFWHGMMHRREPDFSNSKHWFHKVGTHPIFESLREEAARLAKDADDSAAFLATQEAWDPFEFVDLCEACESGKSQAEDICRRIQQREWELLFDFSYQNAVG
ncbi:MAG: hypothetical protein O2954_09445 [bacterium]|nr:hypothetical protein [bacterium]